MGTVRPLPTVIHERSSPRVWRIALKRTLLAVAWLLVSPLILGVWIEQAFRGPGSERSFDGAKELLALSPGLLGRYLRSAFYATVCRAVSVDTCFNLGSIVSTRDVAIGSGTVVGHQTIIGRSVIGRDVMIASRVSIISDLYLHGQPSDRARGIEKERDRRPPSIGDGCWIGENALVMADLGPRCTVAAGAVVVRPAEAGTTLMGNPARKVNL
jgi:acetyltransferase-like isoleucine patch superfamily enzyme